jgi:hypothetical protein
MHHRTLALAVASALPAAAIAQPIPVTNPSFESPATPPGGFTSEPAPGWPFADAGGVVGVFHPTQSSWGYSAPHGNQVLYLNGATVQQDVALLAQAGQTYTLRVLVVHRPNFFQQNYTIRLMAGSTVLAQDLGTLTPPAGQSLTSTLTATVPAGSPAIGQPLRIRLGGPSQTNFDNVRLDIGIPATCYPNCDESTAAPILNVADFTCFLQRFAAGNSYANCDNSTNAPFLNVADFTCFLQRFAAGCR